MKDQIAALRNEVYALKRLVLETLPNQDVFQDVVDFHRKFEIDYDGPPRHLPPDLSLFRMQRIDSEYQELITAKDDEERIDAVVDLMYVLVGYAHVRGWNLREAWRRVHRANMAKELSSPANPGVFGHPTDVVKPAGWIAPDHSDLVRIPDDLREEAAIAQKSDGSSGGFTAAPSTNLTGEDA